MIVRRFAFRCLHTPLFLLVLFCSFTRIFAADVSLTWDSSVTPNVVGYKVYFGNTSRAYGSSIILGNQTTYTVTGLTDGSYYFAVTALDAEGNESDFSNEVFQSIGSSGHSCDINGDSVVDVLDLQLLADVILGIAPGDYDLNGDSLVDVLDLQMLNNVILGLGSCR